MTDSKALINFGDLSKPATILINRLSDFVGGVFRPYQIKRIAKAEAEASMIKCLAEVECAEIHKRAASRLMIEEVKNQENIESVITKALPELNSDSKPENIQEDWFRQFFQKCRLVSDQEMQSLWAKVLAGEANHPGKYSKRTLNFLDSLEKADAMLFTVLCGFSCEIENECTPILFDIDDSMYRDAGLNFGKIKHLSDIGLISMSSSGYAVEGLPEDAPIKYFKKTLKLKFGTPSENSLSVGHVLFTKIGLELSPIAGAKSVPGFPDFLSEKFGEQGIVTSIQD